MIDPSLNRQLRAGRAKEVLTEAIKNVDGDTCKLTKHLLQSIESGALPPQVFQSYAAIGKDPNVVVDGLHQTHSAIVRRAAFDSLRIRLQSETQFRPTWTALRGAPGLAMLMGRLCVKDVHRLCRALGKTFHAPGARDERQQGMSQLLCTLCDIDSNDTSPSNHSAKRDPRSHNLRLSYQHLVKACTEDMCLEWEPIKIVPGDQSTELMHYRAHTEGYRRKLLRVIFNPEEKTVKLHDFQHFFKLDQLFAMLVLSRLVEMPPDWRVDGSLEDFIQYFIIPLGVYMSSRKRFTETHDQFWNLVSAALRRFPGLEIDINPVGQRQTLVILAVKWWSNMGQEDKRLKANSVLQSILELSPSERGLNSWDWTSRLDFLFRPAKVQIARRYDLLQLLFRHLKRYAFDIESRSETDMAKMRTDMQLQPSLLSLLPAEKAVTVVELALYLCPDRSILGSSLCGDHNPGTVLRQSMDDRVDGFMIRSYFQSRLPIASSLKDLGLDNVVEQELRNRRERANNAHDLDERSLWVKLALFLSVAHGSLNMYSDTLRWARRFDKDWDIAKQLYGRELLGNCEGIGLLCAIPDKEFLDSKSPDTVGQDIQLTNGIILQLLDGVAHGLKDGSRPDSMWVFTEGEMSEPPVFIGQLVSQVVQQRVRRVNAFQSFWNISDDIVYELIWQPTLDMLLSVEEFTLKPGNMILGLSCREGMVRIYGQVGGLRGATWRFLDTLAEGRDRLWQQNRVLDMPSVSTLSLPWPRGLPVQCLCAFDITDRPLKLPYVVARATEVVFAEKRVLLSPPPEDEDTKNAYRGFINSFRDCLIIHACGDHPDDGMSIDERVDSLWNYVLGDLGDSRMGRELAIPYWNNRDFNQCFTTKGRRVNVLTRRKCLTIPTTDNPSKPVEWNPNTDAIDGGQSHHVTVPSLGTLCLDILMAQATYRAKKDWSNWSVETRNLWVSGSEYSREALTVTRLLTTNAKYGSEKDFLMEPFPSAKDARFPAIYLADECLPAVYLANEALHRRQYHRQNPVFLADSAPVALLSRLTSSVLKHQGAAFPTMELVKVLSKSDRPSAACSYMQEIILKTPGDNSWHRRLFGLGFFSSLSPSEIEVFLRDMANEIIRHLQDQGIDAVDSKPKIDIATIKMFAEVLRNRRFVSRETALSIVSQLINETGHPGRLTVIKGLLRQRAGLSIEDETRNMAFTALKENLVPVAAALDEGCPLTEENWTKLSENETVEHLPNVGLTESERPVLGLLVDLSTGDSLGDNRYGSGEIKQWAKAMLPKVLEVSIENNTRWMKLFLKKHPHLPVLPVGEDLPGVPVPPKLLSNMLRASDDYPPGHAFDLLRRLVMVNLVPTPGIRAINKAVMSDKRLASSNAGCHWLSLWHNPEDRALDLGVTATIEVLGRPLPPLPAGRDPLATTPTALQDFLVNDVAETLITAGLSTLKHNTLLPTEEKRITTFHQLMVHLMGPWSKFIMEKGVFIHDSGYKAEVVQQIFDRIEEICNSEDGLVRDPNRNRMPLLDVYRIKAMKLETLQTEELPVEMYGKSQEECCDLEDIKARDKMGCKVFAGQLLGLIEESVARSGSRRDEVFWGRYLREAVKNGVTDQRKRMWIAVELVAAWGRRRVGGRDGESEEYDLVLGSEVEPSLVECAIHEVLCRGVLLIGWQLPFDQDKVLVRRLLRILAAWRVGPAVDFRNSTGWVIQGLMDRSGFGFGGEIEYWIK